MYVDPKTREIIEHAKANGLKIRREEVMTIEEHLPVGSLRTVKIINNSPTMAHLDIQDGILVVYIEEPTSQILPFPQATTPPEGYICTLDEGGPCKVGVCHPECDFREKKEN